MNKQFGHVIQRSYCKRSAALVSGMMLLGMGLSDVGANENNSVLAKITIQPTEKRSQILKASLKQVQGFVLVNNGNGYHRAGVNMVLNKSDRVLTMSGASVVVVQENGCVIKLNENSIYLLDQYQNCEISKNSVKQAGPRYVRAIGSEAITDVPPVEQPIQKNEEDDSASKPITSDGGVSSGGLEPGSVQTASEGTTSSGWSTTQIVVTGVAVGLGLAVAGSGGGGNGSVSGQ